MQTSDFLIVPTSNRHHNLKTLAPRQEKGYGCRLEGLSYKCYDEPLLIWMPREKDGISIFVIQREVFE